MVAVVEILLQLHDAVIHLGKRSIAVPQQGVAHFAGFAPAERAFEYVDLRAIHALARHFALIGGLQPEGGP